MLLKLKNSKIFKYAFMGGSLAILDIFLFYTLSKYINWFNASIISYVVITYLNYIFSIKFIFVSESKYSKKKEILLIYLVTGLSVIFNQLILYILIEKLLLEILISKIIAITIMFGWNFLAEIF